MGYNDNGLFIVAKIILQPLDGGNIKVVGRLVQEQDIRLAEKKLDECQFCLLSTGEFAQRTVLIFRREAELTQHRLIFFFVIVTADIFKFFLKSRILFDLAGVGLFVGIGVESCIIHFVEESFHTLLHSVDFGKDFANFLIDSDRIILESHLL